MSGISIKPDREYLREICSKIEDGKYGIPVFQRDYVWKAEQILDLFDSIAKGYPIGTIMLWQPKEYQPKTKDIITDEVKEMPTPEYYVLDGRQRLTTFFGCVSNREDKDNCFKLCYNLETESFEYSKKEKIEVLLVSDIYDTFTLLTRLQNIIDSLGDQKSSKYDENAKRMKAILKGYETGEIMLNNCTLEEAGVVFSRINSKGTKISKASMLQAVSYKGVDDVLLSDEIERILSRLTPYSFDKLSSDDILNCFYRWSSKDFFNAKMNDLEDVNFTTYLPEITDTIEKSAKFLHDNCLVLSADVLPYKKQLVALTWFFKEKKNPTDEEMIELKKWFYYTSYCQIFQNSSLSNVRSVFRRFDDFVKGRKETAIEYEPVDSPSLDNGKFTINSAKANFMMISIIHHARTLKQDEMRYTGYIRIGGREAAHYFPELFADDKNILADCFFNSGGFTDEELDRFVLNNNMINSFISGKQDKYVEERNAAIIECEKVLLTEHGIKIAEDGKYPGSSVVLT